LWSREGEPVSLNRFALLAILLYGLLTALADSTHAVLISPLLIFILVLLSRSSEFWNAG
jgi:hypothetical protein